MELLDSWSKQENQPPGPRHSQDRCDGKQSGSHLPVRVLCHEGPSLTHTEAQPCSPSPALGEESVSHWLTSPEAHAWCSLPPRVPKHYHRTRQKTGCWKKSFARINDTEPLGEDGISGGCRVPALLGGHMPPRSLPLWTQQAPPPGSGGNRYKRWSLLAQDSYGRQMLRRGRTSSLPASRFAPGAASATGSDPPSFSLVLTE